MKDLFIALGWTVAILTSIVLAFIFYYMFIFIGIPIGIFLLVRAARKTDTKSLKKFL